LSGAGSRRNVKPLAFATDEVDGGDQPVDLKPQAREVRSKATGL
jgi:hypothetical protein